MSMQQGSSSSPADRLFLFSPADAAPFAVPTNDTTPLHTPTLPPMSPHLAPAPPPPPANATAAAAAAAAAPAHPPDTERPSHCSEQPCRVLSVHPLFQLNSSTLPSFRCSGATRLVQPPRLAEGELPHRQQPGLGQHRPLRISRSVVQESACMWKPNGIFAHF